MLRGLSEISVKLYKKTGRITGRNSENLKVGVMRKGQDLTDKIYGRLTVLGVHGKAPDGRVLWSVKCECGTVKPVRTHSLTKGDTVSCGCYIRERRYTHGASRRKGSWPEYWIWSSMITRCTSKNSKDYYNYGGRGISVCDEWINSFESFISHIGRRPESNSQLDRINVDGNYEPGNVRWVSPSQNAMNKKVYKNNRTGVKGVGHCHGKFRARLQVNGETVFCEIFDSLLDAAKAYNNAAKKYHGEYAHLNDLSAIA